jgi:hypothetical protein
MVVSVPFFVSLYATTPPSASFAALPCPEPWLLPSAPAGILSIRNTLRRGTLFQIPRRTICTIGVPFWSRTT